MFPFIIQQNFHRTLNSVLTAGQHLEPVLIDIWNGGVIVMVLRLMLRLAVLKYLGDRLTNFTWHNLVCHLGIFSLSYRTGFVYRHGISILYIDRRDTYYNTYMDHFLQEKYIRIKPSITYSLFKKSYIGIVLFGSAECLIDKGQSLDNYVSGNLIDTKSIITLSLQNNHMD